MALDQVENFAKVTVDGPHNDTDTSILLSAGDGSRLPDPTSGEYNLVWFNSTDFPDPADDPNREIVRVTAKTTDTITVVRGTEANAPFTPAASSKNNGGATYKMLLGPTKKTITDIGATIATASVSMFAGSSAPSGFLLCDGAAISRTTFSKLFTEIGTTYGIGDGSSTFNIPNLKGRIPIGLDGADTDFDALNKQGGEKDHTLLTSEMPAHIHRQQRFSTGSNIGHNVQQSQFIDNPVDDGGLDTQSKGGGGAHQNMPPFITLNFIIKT